MKNRRIAHGVFALTILIAGQAFAHANLTGADPADKAIVASPDALNLTFNETPNLEFSKVRLTGPEGKDIGMEAPMLMNSDKTIMVPVSDTLEPGLYTVNWSVLSVDGHKLKGAYTFTVKP